MQVLQSAPGSQRSARALKIGVSLLAAAALTACVIVPLDPKTGQPYPSSAPPVVVVQQPAPAGASGAGGVAGGGAAPAWTTVNVRLYPINEAARSAGILAAVVMDNNAGRGSFSVTYLGQSLQGEATRVDRSFPGFGGVLQQVLGAGNWAQAGGQRGIANAASGAYSMRCEYLFTSMTQGTGACVVSDGARYQIHFGG